VLLDATGLTKDIKQWVGTDYIARIIVTESELGLIQRVLFSTITYDNFKDSIHVNAMQRDKSGLF